MRDDVPVPPEHDDASREALERDLRALFAPTAAPRRFRQQLKSELLRDQRARIALPPDARIGSRLAWLGAHRRTAFAISGALAIAAALLLTAAIRGLTLTPVSTLRPGAPPRTPTATATHAPARVIAPAPTATPTSAIARPTHTPSPRAQQRHHSSTPMPRKSAVAPPRRHHSSVATVTPEPTATTAAPTATVAAPAATATTPAIPPAPPSTATDTPSVTPSATATAPPPPPATATPHRQTHPPRPDPTATPTTKALTLPALGHTTAPASPTATPRHRREVSPTATPTVTIPALGVKIALPPAPRATATRPLATPPMATRPLATPPLATASPTATPRPTASATPRPTSSATPQPSATPSATASPTSTPPGIVINPLAQPYGLPVPNAGNGILASPLTGALPYAQQPVSYSVATTLTLAAPQELPVYPLTTTDATTVDALTIARQVGATAILSGPTVQPDGSLLATIQIGTLRYTLDVFGGAGTPWFTLRAVQSSAGHATPARVAVWADAWLRAHGLASPDLRLLDAGGDTASYGQNVGGLPLLGPVAIQLRFDGRGVLQDLSYTYVRPTADIPSALQAPALAAAAAIDQGQGLYQGPSASTVSGPATIGAVTLAYVGVHGIHNYLEPIYVLSGTAPTASGAQPFNLYTPALQYAAPTSTPAATP